MNRVRKMVIAAVCSALCLILPFLTGNNRELGTLFSLMHLPVATIIQFEHPEIT